MQIYLNFACNFFYNTRSFGMNMIIYSCITPTAQMSRTRHYLRVKLVLLWLLFSVQQRFLYFVSSPP